MNKKFILIFIFLVSCTFSDDTSPKNSPMETTVITTVEGVRSTNYLDYREIKLLRAETVTDETIDFLNEYVEFSEKKLFSDPRLKFENIYPIIIAQLDRNNYQAAIDLETEYCDYLENNHEYTFEISKCNPDNQFEDWAKKEDGSLGILTEDGRPMGSAINATKREGRCCYLFISESHDEPMPSIGYVTIHEMFHIFQNSNLIDLSDDRNALDNIAGKRRGDDGKKYPFWKEGPAVYYSYLWYAREINDFDFFKNEMRSVLFSCYCGDGQAPIIDRYLNGPKLYDVTWESDADVGYQVGAWFVAYLNNIHGEEPLFDFWINTQTGILFEDNFLEIYGKDYRTYVDEFEDFIRNNDEETIMSILPTS